MDKPKAHGWCRKDRLEVGGKRGGGKFSPKKLKVVRKENLPVSYI